MNNSQNRTQRGLLDNQRGSTNAGYDQFLDTFRGKMGSTIDESRDLRNQIRDKYTAGFMPEGLKPNASGWFDTSSMPGMGGVNSAAFDPNGDFASARKGYQGFADTGGRENYADAEGAFKGFVNNGGIGESEANALRARATAQIPAFYGAYKNAAQRRANVQGGYSPGFDSQMEELGREQARQGFGASRQVEGDIADKRIQGREFGASGLAGIGRDVSGNQLSGLGGLTNIGQAGQQNAQFNAGLNESASGRNQALQLALLGMYGDSGKAGAAGLSNLYSSAPGDVGQYLQNYLAGLGGQSNANLANLGQRGQIQDRSFLDYLPGLVGAAGGIMGGIGGLRGPRNGNRLPGSQVQLPRY